MQWFNKLPGSVRSPSGLEWKLWRKLPLILLTGTALPLLVLALLHLTQDDTLPMVARNLQMADYVVIGVVLFHWTAVGTVAIGCALVMVMKGPGYVADGFLVSHSDRPDPDDSADVTDSPSPKNTL